MRAVPDDKQRKDDSDPLYLNTVYPEASPVFTFSPKPLHEVLKDAVFVLDTNALLVPYGTDPASLDAIRTTYTKLLSENRLVVPAQAAREFAKNRPERLKTAYDQLAQRQSLNVTESAYPLLAELPDYKALKKIEDELAAKVKEYRAAIKTVLSKVRGWYWDDPVSAMYRTMFTDKVVLDVKLKGDDLKTDVIFRQIHKVPPGYKDSSKDTGSAGDLIIWRTILEIGRNRKKHVVFVSGEEKADWWYRASEGVLYPRFELLDEYRRASDGQTFHIMRLADLLAEYGAKQEIVDAVREEEAALQPVLRPTARWWPDAEEAVMNWLGAIGTVSKDPATGYLVMDRKGALVHCEIRIVGIPARAVEKIQAGINGATARRALPYMLLLVAHDLEAARRVRPAVVQHMKASPPEVEGIEVRLGFLTATGKFLPWLRVWPPPG